MISQPTIGSIVHGFFEDYLKLEKGLRPNSIKSYRDALRLFLQFSAQEARCNLTRLSLDDLTAERVARFLDSLEVTRENQIRSRNLRLTALRVFFEYLGRQLPERLLQAQRVVSISTKRTPPPTTSYLEREEMEALFAGMPNTGRFALRDRALLLFLFNTGARVQEVADLRVANLDFAIGPRVRLHGKGDKWRLCPLWDETVALLTRLLAESGQQDDPTAPVFSARGLPLTRFGIYKIVRRHTENLIQNTPNARRISPHVFRHSAASTLLESGADLNVVRAWLGHTSLDTTHRYAEINIRTKAEAIKRCEPPVSAYEKLPKQRAWNNDAALLNWLQSL